MALLILALVCVVAPVFAQGEDLRIHAVRADGTFVVTMPEGVQAQPRDIFTVSRGGKGLGDAMVVVVKKQEAVFIPKASFKGVPRAGDTVVFARHADAPLDETASWVKYRAPDGSFTIMLPHLPAPGDIKVEKQVVSSGPVTRTIFEISDRNQDMLYAVCFFDYTLVRHEGKHYEDDDGHLDRTVRNYSEDGQHAVRSTRSCTLNGFPGREVEAVTRNGKQVARTRLYMVGTRLYILTVNARRAGVSSNASRFLNSFELARKKK